MSTGNILEDLARRGLIDRPGNWSIEPATGGLNSRVFTARPDGYDPVFTIRLRGRQDRSVAEVEGLSDSAGCPGVPALRLLTNELVVLDYMAGTPRDFHRLSADQIKALGESLVCIHESSYESYTLWPLRTSRPGDRTDLLRFRISSLTNYESYAAARDGKLQPQLAELIERLAQPEPDLVDPSWLESEFSRLHGDLSFGNILWNKGDLALIDWEYSRVGDPAEDLAYLLVEQAVSLEDAKLFRQAYVGAGGDPDSWRRVPIYTLFTAIDSSLWWADYAIEHDRPAGEEIAVRVATAEAWLPLLRA